MINNRSFLCDGLYPFRKVMFGGYEWMKITPANSSSALFLGVIWLMDTLDEENESDNIAAIMEESWKEENKEQTVFIE